MPFPKRSGIKATRRLPMAKVAMVTSAVYVGTHLLAKGQFVTATSKLIADSFAQCIANRPASWLMACGDRHAEKSNAEPGGRALHRMRPRGREIDYPTGGKAALGVKDRDS